MCGRLAQVADARTEPPQVPPYQLLPAEQETPQAIDVPRFRDRLLDGELARQGREVPIPHLHLNRVRSQVPTLQRRRPVRGLSTVDARRGGGDLPNVPRLGDCVCAAQPAGARLPQRQDQAVRRPGDPRLAPARTTLPSEEPRAEPRTGPAHREAGSKKVMHARTTGPGVGPGARSRPRCAPGRRYPRRDGQVGAAGVAALEPSQDRGHHRRAGVLGFEKGRSSKTSRRSCVVRQSIAAAEPTRSPPEASRALADATRYTRCATRSGSSIMNLNDTIT